MNISEDPLSTGIIVFVDGSSSIDQCTGLRHTGAAVVALQHDSFFVSQWALPNNFSAQAAELIVVIVALSEFQNSPITIYSDSAYVCSTIHVNASVWERRGFVKSDGSPA